MGSVKHLVIDVEPTENSMGSGRFIYSNDTSVFDAGKLGFGIEYKGASLCSTATNVFRSLADLGMLTHFISNPAPNEMEVYLVRKFLPWEDKITPDTTNYIIPLEVIFRNYIGKTSSVRKRVAKGELSWEDIGLDHEPAPDERLEKPFIDYSTKFEPVDRYFRNKEEAREYVGLSKGQINGVEYMANKTNDLINQKTEPLGWRHEDGKIEIAITPKGHLMVVDEVGNLDSDKFIHLATGFPLSKDVIRNYYRGGEWHKALQKAQDAGVDPKDYPKAPTPDQRLLNFTSQMYQAAHNAECSSTDFKVKPLDDLMKEDYQQLVNDSVIKV